MENKVCNIPKATKKEGSCSLNNRCCRNCYRRGACKFPCLLSWGENCKFKGGAVVCMN